MHMKLKDLDLSKTASPRRGISFGPTFLIFVLAVVSLTVLFVVMSPKEQTPPVEEVADSTSRFSPVYWNTIVIPSLMKTAPTPPIR